MPMYDSNGTLEIHCDCEHIFEVEFDVDSTGKEKCPKCGKEWNWHMDFW
jgi:hypothetical protein